jgi:hypothetical protein
MQTAATKEDIVIRIPKKLYDENVQELLNYIEYKKIVSKSKATQKDIDSIMSGIKKERKNTMKPLLNKIKQKVK